MSMPYPQHEVYANLYARYLKGERTRQMLSLAGDLQGKSVADLCGGGGRLAAAAAAAGARVTLVDQSPEMLPKAPLAGVTSIIRDVGTWLTSFTQNNEFDAMFCQQAVNYWLNQEHADCIAHSLRKGGVFIFNTFNRKPSHAPAIKQYELEGVKFVEASWLTDENTVQHVQMREGEPPHTTQFRWIAPEEFAQWFKPRFEAVEHREGASSVWVCTRLD